MSKRTSNKEQNDASRKAERKSHTAGPVNIGTIRPFKGGNKLPKGGITNNYIKSGRYHPGDKLPVFGKEPKEPNIIGGEGGRGWTVRSTFV